MLNQHYGFQFVQQVQENPSKCSNYLFDCENYEPDQI
jgi:hypothetical protein